MKHNSLVTNVQNIPNPRKNIHPAEHLVVTGQPTRVLGVHDLDNHTKNLVVARVCTLKHRQQTKKQQETDKQIVLISSERRKVKQKGRLTVLPYSTNCPGATGAGAVALAALGL